MKLANSHELEQILSNSYAIAEELAQEHGSAHLLGSLFMSENKARELLEERGILSDDALNLVESAPLETPGIVDKLWRKTEQVARDCNAQSLDSLHLLSAITRLPASLAYQVLNEFPISLQDLRSVVMSYAAGRVKRRFQSTVNAYFELVTVGTPGSRPTGGPGRVSRISSTRMPVQTDFHSPHLPVLPGDVQNSISRGELDPEIFPLLSRLGRNLTLEAREGRFDPLVGRERELEAMVDILRKRRSNNPCLVGDPGVGKTALVEGLAHRMAHTQVPIPGLEGRLLVELEIGGLIAGTHLRGSLAEKMKELKEEVKQADGKIIIFIDEIHMLVRAGATEENAQDAANDLKAALSRGEFPCIGATTLHEYKLYIEKDPALERRFQMVRVDEPNEHEALNILRGVEQVYARHHQVRYLPQALAAAVRLSQRTLHSRRLPAKALDVLDRAGSHASRLGQQVVDVESVATVIAEMASLPRESLVVEEKSRLLELEQRMRERIIGHREAISTLCAVIRRKFAGFHGKRPYGSFLLYGASGVGKTITANVLAELLFQDSRALQRFDMAEFQERGSISRLIGTTAGFVGYEDGGQLTEAVRHRPYQLLLFENVERAHADVKALLNQLVDEGTLTDSKGRLVSFAHCVVMFTATIEDEELQRLRNGGIGFVGDALNENEQREQLSRSAERLLPHSLRSRLDATLLFLPLSEAEIRKVTRVLVQQSSELLMREAGIQYTITEKALEELVARSQCDDLRGMRPIVNEIQRHLEAAIAELILRDVVREGDSLVVKLDGQNRFMFEAQARPEPVAPAAFEPEPLVLEEEPEEEDDVMEEFENLPPLSTVVGDWEGFSVHSGTSSRPASYDELDLLALPLLEDT